MSKTAFSTSNALTKKLWQEKLFRDTVKESYFSKFMGDNMESLVYTKTDLEKGQGDKLTFGIRMRLSASGVTSGQALEGNEESLTTYDYSLTLEQYRHAVRDDGAMSRKRAMFSISEEAVSALKDWGAEKIDSLLFTALQASPTKIFYGGDATSAATLEAGDKLTPVLISKVKAWAVTGGGRSGALPPIRPIRVNGGKYYVLLVHPDQMFDLKRNSEFTQAMREAEIRGPQNPLFNNATAIWDGVVIHEHENITRYTTWGAGSDVSGASGMFMGAQALCWGFGERPNVVNKMFDYDNEQGYAWGMIAAAGKPKFNSKDYGVIGVYTARTGVAES